ncbi:TniQ family protein [Bacillus sp. RG28]|uniref:TniQ family protein n=1 Tax=Gottfriedia endophytica TaxID=2820819 RepID=A0A940NTC8_9BACI|nr:TniQ family protein [Gottfriedia endophytica]MBP0726712.1 TniQ family protein [Gottfriedia endophytica]
MSKRYLIVPQPKTDESLAGYLQRLSIENNYDSVSWIYNDLGFGLISNLNIYYHFYKQNILKKLIELTGLTKESILKMTYWYELGDIYNGDSYFQNYLRKRFSRFSSYNIIGVCPVCLKEDQYVRKIWELSLYKICYKHNCHLIDSCPNCYQPIMLTNSTEKCKCGFIYTTAKPIFVNKKENQVGKFLYCLIYEKKENLSSGNILSKFNLKVFIFLILYFSLKIDSTKFHSKLSYNTINKAFKIFETWPYGFYDFLKTYRKSKKLNFGGPSAFSSVYMDIYKKFKYEDELNFILTSFEEFLLYEMNEGVLLRKTNPKLINKNLKWLSKYSASKYLGVTMKTVNLLVEEKNIETRITSNGRKDVVQINFQRLIKLIEAKSNMIPAYSAAKLLGISKKLLLSLVKAGILNKIREGEKSYFDLRKIEMLLDTFENTSKKKKSSGKDLTKFSGACKVGLDNKPGLINIITYVLQNKLTPILIKKNAVGFNKYGFYKSDILNVHKQESSKTSYFSIYAVSEKLNIPSYYIKFLVENNYIESLMINNRKMITEESIKEYSRKYITSLELARKFNISATKIKKIVLENKINPIVNFPIQKVLIKRPPPSVYVIDDIMSAFIYNYSNLYNPKNVLKEK